MTRTIGTLLVAAAVALPAASPAASAAAGPAALSGPGGAHVVGTAVLPVAPGAGSGTFTSTVAVGADVGGGLVTKVTASFGYQILCTGGVPLLGNASGTITVWHGSVADPPRSFNAVAVGNAATISGGVSGTATFAMGSVLSCTAPTPATVTVVADITW